ncbi:hypothetical protein ACWKWZ_24690, partial [Metapseudomonas otitidis]
MSITSHYNPENGSPGITVSKDQAKAYVEFNSNGQAFVSGDFAALNIKYDQAKGTYSETVKIPVTGGWLAVKVGNAGVIQPNGTLKIDSIVIGGEIKGPGPYAPKASVSAQIGAGIDEDGDRAFKVKLKADLEMGPFKVRLESDEFYLDPADLIDPDENGLLSKGLLGNAYAALKHRSDYTDAQVDAAVNGVDPNVNLSFNNANNFVQRIDPLSLDLDGDGIETVGANAGITFDFDGDGLKTGTGWVKGDDGFLVLDRNGNDQIDNGGELFGVDTVKANGQKATDGFDALKDFDSNGDGVFDAQDTQFTNVKIWQDTNQDGIAQNGELKTLAEHNIVAINLDAKASNHNSNGNLISAIGSFVRGDGSEGTVNANQSLAANLDLASNPFYREFTDPIALDDAAKALPDMKGSGAVRDLREASMLNAELKTLLATYAQAQTREEQMGLLDKLIAEWAESSGYRTFDQRISALDTDQIRFAFSYSWEKPDQDKFQTGSGGSSGGLVTTNEKESNKTPTAVQLDQKATLEKIKILEVFNSQNFFNFNRTEPKTPDDKNDREYLSIRLGSIIRTMGGVSLSGQATYYITEADLSPAPAQAQFINSAYEALKQSIYDSLLLQTRLKPYIERIGLTITNTGVELEYSEMTKLFEQTAAISPVKAISEALELEGSLRGKFLITSTTERLISRFFEGLSDNDIRKIRQQSEQAGYQLIVGDRLNNQLTGTALNDQVYSGAGNDTVYGRAGNDLISGGDGNDVL